MCVYLQVKRMCVHVCCVCVCVCALCACVCVHSRADDTELHVGHQLCEEPHAVLPLLLAPELTSLGLTFLKGELVVGVRVLKHHALVH